MCRQFAICTLLSESSFADLARVSGGTFLAITLLCLSPMSFSGERAMGESQATVSGKSPEILRSFPLTNFYDTPDVLPPGKPGELIRATTFEEYDLPPGVSAVRLLYHSRSATNDDVVTSGVIMFLDEKPPVGGWPVIAWAHGLSGVARQCAPSLARNLQHGPLLSMYVSLGYAVVATDYTGLGTRFRNAFADTSSNALDVLYAIPAARHAVPQLGGRWIAMGSGEGGMAVAGVAEQEHEIQDPSYLGSIAISPLADFEDVYKPVSSLAYRLPLFLAYGIKTVYPQFEVNEILTEKALPLYREIGQVCSENETVRKASAVGMLKPNWDSNSFVLKYFSRNHLGLKPAHAPLLVISGQSDASVGQTTKIVARLCQQGDRVQFEKYPEDDPGRVIGDSVRDQIAWIQARFANGPVPDNCAAQH
jgi:Secretory lipase